MRILQVVQELAPGGAERLVVMLVEAGRLAGHQVTVAAAPGSLGHELELETHPIPLVARRPQRVPAAAWAVRRAVVADRPDVVHAHNPVMAVATAFATLRGRRPPALVTFHGVPDEDYPRAARLLRLAGLPVVACAPGVAAGLAEHGCSSKTTIVNGVSPAPESIPRADFERRVGLDPARKVVVAVGRLVDQKNHVLAVRALAQVPGASLLVLGEGPLRDEIEREARAAGVDGRVVLAGTQPEARAILGAADVLVLPSRWEGLPLVALEALTAGVPVVATAVRGVQELLTDGQDALLVPPGDPAALAGALSSVLDDLQLTRRLVQNGRDLVKRYTAEAMTARYLALYENVATGGRSG